jgi:ParB family chromosome partitioning protein
MTDEAASSSVPPRRRGLGMGLSALLGSPHDHDVSDGAPGHPPAPPALRRVPIESLKPSRVQPRRCFDDEDLEALADSISTNGILQPLLVRPATGEPGRFEIIAGERRWRAAQRAGLHEMPVVERSLDDREALEVALIENVQRADLSPLEEAEGYRRLIDDFGHTQEALAQAIGKSRSHVANLLRLLALPDLVREHVEAGRLSAGHARALLGAYDPVGLAAIVLERGLNVRQTESLVRAAAKAATAGRPPQATRPADTVALESRLSGRIGLPVRLTPKGEGGTITIAYSSLEQLDGLLSRFAG